MRYRSTQAGQGYGPATALGGYETALRLSDPTASRFQIYEYLFYGQLLYAQLAVPLGISVGSVGAAMTAGIATLCLLGLRRGEAALVFRGLVSPLLCAGSFIFLQTLGYGESLMHELIRPFVIWVLNLVIIKCLCTRPGFLERAANALFAAGLCLLPFLKLDYTDEFRAGLDPTSGISAANPNVLAAWFGFCGLVFLIRDLETRRQLKRFLCWSLSFFCVFIIGLTVSRGALAGFGVAVVVAFRKQMNRSFVPLLMVVIIAGGAFSAGVFDEAIAHYTERGAEDSGRMAVWPYALQRFLESPVMGVGVAELATAVPGRKPTTPHNGLLFFALSSGIVPAVFFVCFWVNAFRGAIYSWSGGKEYGNYLLPLVVFALVVDQLSNNASLESWAAITLCVCLHQLSVRRAARRRLEFR
jgi:O-antigen ligase